MGSIDSDGLLDLDTSGEQELTERRRAPTQPRRVVAVWATGSQVLDVGGRSEVSIGRGTGCDLRIDDPSVSRRHAVLHLSPTAIEDCGSTNGTTVGGARVPSRQHFPIPYDAPISIGNAIVVLQLVHHDVDWEVKTDAGVRRIESKMDQLSKQLELVAKSPLSVLIVGETGVGKEVATDRLHALSRRSGSLVKINCAALPEHLLEAELFGYERGSFTGAVASKPGLVEAAEGGTLFLDEVGELPLSTQAKLLRVLESREVQRLGALRARVIDVRFVAATNRKIEGLVRAGSFRSDLYFRLNGMTLEIPPLRERIAELSEYVHKFIQEMCAKLGRRPTLISEEAMQRLRSHRWPGNLRELRNVIDRALLLAGQGRIEGAHIVLGSEDVMAAREGQPWDPSTRLTGQTLPEGTLPPSAAGQLSPSDTIERRRIVEALAKTGGNQTEAAKLLGVSRRTLVYKLGQLAIPRPRKQTDET
ncbi:MAG TPA: sigma 54-interacting transcriptional regulator [Labilithrix sp.]|nr:sigma 54-interacting transcriptional regulator [Labilithrix sp.]